MTGEEDEFVYDPVIGEWVSRASAEAAVAAELAVEVRDAFGALLADGDDVALVADRKVTGPGAGQVLKRGTIFRGVRLTGQPKELECRHPQIKGLILHGATVRKL